VAVIVAACGGTSIEHRQDGSGATSGSAGTSQGATGGTGGAVGGAGGTTGGTGGTTGGAGGTTGGATTCASVVQELAAELTNIQRCTTASDCGQVLIGTSCGCTRDLVARLDADTTRFHQLRNMRIDGTPCAEFSGTCDCPAADGFACLGGACAWNYVHAPPPDVCTPADVGVMCVVGAPLDAGDALTEGMPLELSFRPLGCFSSGCTQAIRSSCDAQPDGADFVASADICLNGPVEPSTGCTGDCDTSIGAHCLTMNTLTAGTHTVHYPGHPELDVTFTVPSVVTDGSLCSGKPF
jgi:hypothetical protein